MVNIKCEHPVIIRNPYLQYLVIKYQVVQLGNRYLDFRLSNGKEGGIRSHSLRRDWDYKIAPLFKINYSQVTLDTIDDYFVINQATGETYPVYLAVPCGKCALCKEHKAQMWQTRCLAETATSDYPPLFITLTYDNDHLPSEGVNKRDVQLFLKRLRKRIAFDGYDNHLRYILVSEYGKNTHRAHYHLLLWNMPYISSDDPSCSSWLKLKQYIEECWQNGFIAMEKCKDASGKYCMKYLRKECYIPEGKNDTFLLASRRRGIGFAFADELTEFMRSNPGQTSISIGNKFDGSVTNCAIPDYFKRLWFPSLSGIVKQEVRDDVSRFMTLARNLTWLSRKYDYTWLFNEIIDNELVVEEKYSFCPEDFDFCVPDRLFVNEINAHIRNYLNITYKTTLDNDFFENYAPIADLINEYRSCYQRLCSYYIDKDLITSLLDLHQTNSDLLRASAMALDPLDIDGELGRVRRLNNRLDHPMRPDDLIYD